MLNVKNGQASGHRRSFQADRRMAQGVRHRVQGTNLISVALLGSCERVSREDS